MWRGGCGRAIHGRCRRPGGKRRDPGNRLLHPSGPVAGRHRWRDGRIDRHPLRVRHPPRMQGSLQPQGGAAHGWATAVDSCLLEVVSPGHAPARSRVMPERFHRCDGRTMRFTRASDSQPQVGIHVFRCIRILQGIARQSRIEPVTSLINRDRSAPLLSGHRGVPGSVFRFCRRMLRALLGPSVRA